MSSTATKLADEKFVSLTTFKKDGDGIAEPMWIATLGDQLVMMTGADSWKVKRLRRDPRVTLVPSDRSGKVTGNAAPVEGTAEIVTDADDVVAVVSAVKRKYGLMFHVISLIKKIAARGRTPQPVGLRITLT
jgi:PPOX class probable F420-dependent enzyme